MPNVYLVLTNPYAYKKALARALEGARRSGTALNAVFLIDPEAMEEMVYDLGERGWLGPGSMRQLQDSMMEGYRALAKDVLEEVQHRAAEAGVTLQSAIEEVTLDSYLRNLLAQQTGMIIVSGAGSLTTRLGRLARQVELIEEEE